MKAISTNYLPDCSHKKRKGKQFQNCIKHYADYASKIKPYEQIVAKSLCCFIKLWELATSSCKLIKSLWRQYIAINFPFMWFITWFRSPRIVPKNNCSPGTPLPTTDVYRNVRYVPDLADEGDITALAFPHLQFSLWVSPRPGIPSEEANGMQCL